MGDLSWDRFEPAEGQFEFDDFNCDHGPDACRGHQRDPDIPCQPAPTWLHYDTLGIQPGPKTPDGVYARVIEGRTLYVNSTGEPKEIPIEGTMTGLLSGKKWSGTLKLDPLDAELLAK